MKQLTENTALSNNAMKHYLLDSGVIINYLNGIPSTVELIQNLHQQGNILCTSDVVIAEVYATLTPHDRAAAEPLLSSLTFLPSSLDAARQAGECRHKYSQAGTFLSITDCLSAATALAHGAALVTGNTKDYPQEELTVLPLPRPEEKGGHAA